MNNRVKLAVVSLASALAVALVALALVMLRPQAEATTPAPDAAVKTGAAVEQAGGTPSAPTVIVQATPADNSSGSGSGGSGGSGQPAGGNTGGGNTGGGKTGGGNDGGGNTGGGGGVKPPRPPIHPPVGGFDGTVLDPGTPHPTTTTTVKPPADDSFPCRVFKLCQDGLAP